MEKPSFHFYVMLGDTACGEKQSMNEMLGSIDPKRVNALELDHEDALSGLTESRNKGKVPVILRPI